MGPRLPAHRRLYVVTLLASIALWAMATVPSGFSIVQLLIFAGPGIVLAVAASWMSHAFAPDRWSWDDALSAAIVGAVVFPPVVALFVAWTATLETNGTILLFILGSWVALGAGIVWAAVGMIIRRRTAPRPAAAQVELLQ